jgi:antitoxin YokJ
MTMDIATVLAMIRQDTNCSVFPPAGAPHVRPSQAVPDDLREFYRLCGGLVLFVDSVWRTVIVAPGELVPANPVIVGEEGAYDISCSWYIVASDGTDSQKMTIDLNPTRLGRCYDSFWDRHAVAGSSTIIALSFTEFLRRSYACKGTELYWCRDDFVPLGDAYD